MAARQSRDSILLLLRRSGQTAEQVALQLSVTRNAARAQLNALERDGLVSVRLRKRGGVGKPAHVYSLTAAGEVHFSRAYVPFLLRLLDELSDRHPPSELDTIMAAVGARMAAGRFVELRTERAHAEAAATVLTELGGDVEVESGGEQSGYTVRSHGCPLASAVRSHAAVCRSVQSLMSRASGAIVVSLCDHGAHPNCWFSIGEEGHQADASGATI